MRGTSAARSYRGVATPDAAIVARAAVERRVVGSGTRAEPTSRGAVGPGPPSREVGPRHDRDVRTNPWRAPEAVDPGVRSARGTARSPAGRRRGMSYGGIEAGGTKW